MASATARASSGAGWARAGQIQSAAALGGLVRGTVQLAATLMCRWGRWVRRRRRWLAWCLVLAGLAAVVDESDVARLLLALGLLPGLVVALLEHGWPTGYERCLAGPLRRMGWRRWARRSWPAVARECGLSVQRSESRSWWLPAPAPRVGRSSNSGAATVWISPRLAKVVTEGSTLTLRIRPRVGQTVEDIENAAPALAFAAAAVSHRVRQFSPSLVDVVLVLREALAFAREARLPDHLAGKVVGDRVGLGRRQDGRPWEIRVRGRHTLVVGCSGSGKGSLLWGLCGGLSPAVHAGSVQLWGVDLKRGVEVMMGRQLFASVAVTPDEAVVTLKRLLAVIEERGREMAGVSRLHCPRPGDPLHVLVIDELAALTAYSEGDTKREASRLLAEILTQGRALGVVVLACVQDPRKEVVSMRGLFTQTVALRLRSADETRMVLGDGAAPLAPAHRLSPSAPGSAWVVEEDGSLDRVRADYWPDRLVRQAAATYPAPVLAFPPVVSRVDGEATQAHSPSAVDGAVAELAGRSGADFGRETTAGRKPRKPRKPRASRGGDEPQAGPVASPSGASERSVTRSDVGRES